jgi:LacI family transcriptional regulator/LacI family repressor for deo operon, udp, cdd, tsx, nupC, and nupG
MALRSVGFLIKEIDNPYYADIIAGADEYLRERGYLLLTATSEGDYTMEQRITDLFRGQEIVGLIVTPVLDAQADVSHIFELKRRNIPFVLLEEIRGLQANLVDVDNVQGAQRAVRHLIELGHQRIAHFAGPEYSLHSAQRIGGVRAAYSESSLIFSDSVIVSAGASLEDGYRTGLAYFRSLSPDERPTAITCYNDLIALGLCRALAELEIRIPEDVSVIGYDDLPLLDYVTPRLSSVKVPTREMGRAAAEILHNEIENGTGRPPRKVYLEAQLVLRDSTTPPRAHGRQHRTATVAVTDGSPVAAGSR